MSEHEPPHRTVPGRVEGEYWMEPAVIETVVARIRALMEGGLDFLTACERVTPSITDQYLCSGREHIPKERPIVVATNHPTHLDSILIHPIVQTRPNLRLISELAKDASAPLHEMSDRFFPLRKAADRHAASADVKDLLRQLKHGMSVVIVPWGSMDHRAGINPHSSVGRGIANVMRFARLSGAQIVPVQISVEWENPGQVPFRSYDINIGEPIPHENEAAVEAALRRLYPRKS